MLLVILEQWVEQTSWLSWSISGVSSKQTKDTRNEKYWAFVTFYCQFPDIYDFAKEDDVTTYTRELSSWSGTLTDIDHSNIIRCHAFIMDSGTCLRMNIIPLYMEANRQVWLYRILITINQSIINLIKQTSKQLLINKSWNQSFKQFLFSETFSFGSLHLFSLWLENDIIIRCL